MEMVVTFPVNIQKEVYGYGHRNKECGKCGGYKCTI